MYISEVNGSSKRLDDAMVISQVGKCEGTPLGPAKILGLMNESKQVYRLVICSGSTEFDCIVSSLRSRGFSTFATAPTSFRGLVDTLLWKA